METSEVEFAVLRLPTWSEKLKTRTNMEFPPIEITNVHTGHMIVMDRDFMEAYFGGVLKEEVKPRQSIQEFLNDSGDR